nr:transglycosylase SLT domain-containing protein [Magnetofaba australis]
MAWIVLTAPQPALADIYAFVDKDGVIHISNKPSDKRYRRLMRVESDGRRKGVYSGKYASLIYKEARRNRIDPALVRAVIRVESSFNPDAESHKGAVGLMQLMPRTAAQYGVRNRRDPSANVRAGSKHLRKLMLMYNNDLRLTLAAYNAGEGAVKKYGNRIPPYPETQNYVAKVLRYYRQYQRAM